MRITSRTTLRRLTDAAVQADRVPGLEADLATTRRDLEAAQSAHATEREQRQALKRVQADTAHELRELTDRLHATAELLVEGTPPAQAQHLVAGMLLDLEQNDVLGLEPETIAHLRTMVAPRQVHVLLRDGELLSTAYPTSQAAQDDAERMGAHPDGWNPDGHSLDTSPRADLRSAVSSPWCRVTLHVDAARPWLTRGTVLRTVWVVMAADGVPYRAHSIESDAHVSVADAGLTSDRVHRLDVRLRSTAGSVAA